MSTPTLPRYARVFQLAETYATDSHERLLLLEAAQMMKRNDDAGYEFAVVAIVSKKSGAGLLDVSWGGYQAQLETVKAREIAWMLLEGASVAEAEAAVMRFARERIHLSEEKASWMLNDFRHYRKTGLDGTILSERTDG